MIQVFTPSMGEEEIEAVAEVIRSGWIGLGPKTKLLEESFASYVGVDYAVGVNSCTAALDLALKLLGVGSGDDVLVPTMTFVSTAHAVAYNNARPIFVDCEQDTLNFDLLDLCSKITPRTKAIIVVHYGGRPTDMDLLRDIAGDIPIIEDCAHAAGSTFNGKMCGSIGDIGCFSFHAVKNLAAGDGGCLTMNNKEFHDKAKRLRWLGIDKGTWDRTGDDRSYWWKYDVNEIGLKCHMNDITAALALVQLGKLDNMNERRRDIASMYFKGLSSLVDCGVRLPINDGEGFSSSWHIFHLKVNPSDRDDLSEHLRDFGVNTGVHYMPIHLYNCYGWQPPLAESEKMKDCILTLPMHAGLTDDEVVYIIESIKGFYAKV